MYMCHAIENLLFMNIYRIFVKMFRRYTSRDQQNCHRAVPYVLKMFRLREK